MKLKAPTLANFWGEQVRANRVRIGFSQAELAERAGTTQQTISRTEKGVQIPLDDLKLQIAKALCMHPGDLFAWPEGIAA